MARKAYLRRKIKMGVHPKDLIGLKEDRVKRSERDMFIDDKFKQGFSFDAIEKMLEIRSVDAFRKYCLDHGIDEGGKSYISL